MSKPAAKVPEPSMEEILASIRRIISDENSAPAPAVAAPAPAPAAPKPAAPAPAVKKVGPPPPPPATPAIEEPVKEEEADVLELTEMVAAKAQDDFDKVEVAADVMFRDAEPMREVAPRMSAPARMDNQLLSQHTSSAVSSAFGALSNSMFAGDSRTVDELVREMLRPMLKAWLDDNLPSLVERLVRSEIERVSRGR
jgi:cell pole-organizing protein PopZ